MNYILVAGANGFVSQQLPAAVGPGTKPPAFVCYILNPADGVWYPIIAEPGFDVYCSLFYSEGVWTVGAGGLPPGASVALVVVY